MADDARCGLAGKGGFGQVRRGAPEGNLPLLSGPLRVNAPTRSGVTGTSVAGRCQPDQAATRGRKQSGDLFGSTLVQQAHRGAPLPRLFALGRGWRRRLDWHGSRVTPALSLLAATKWLLLEAPRLRRAERRASPRKTSSLAEPLAGGSPTPQERKKK